MYTWSALIDLKKELDVFETEDYDLDVRNAMKKIRLNSPGMKMVVLGNFDVEEGQINPDFYSTGTWYEYWTGDSIVVTNVTDMITLKEGEFRLYTDSKLDKPEYVGIDENIVTGTISDFILYPNPASNHLKLEMHLKQTTNANIEIYDMQGRLVKNVFNGQLTGGIRNLEVNIDGINPGLYFVSIQADNQRIVTKLMVQ